MAWARSVYGVVAAVVLALSAIAGGFVAVNDWIDSHLASAEDVQQVRVRLLYLERENAEAKRAALRREKFSIQNSLELERRRPTQYERARLNELDEELPRADKAVERLDQQITREGKP